MSRRYTIINTEGVETVHQYEGEEPSLDELQKAVGGLIEHVIVMYKGERKHAYINEEGKLDGLPLNWHIGLAPEYQDVIMGNVVVMNDEEIG